MLLDTLAALADYIKCKCNLYSCKQTRHAKPKTLKTSKLCLLGHMLLPPILFPTQIK